MSDYWKSYVEAQKNLEPSKIGSKIAGLRCRNCGRVISVNDRAAYKTSIGNEETFFNAYEEYPARKEAVICGRCAHFYEDAVYNKSPEARAFVIRIFCDDAIPFEKTNRARLEDIDMLNYFATIQNKFRALGVDTCIKAIISTNCKCQFEPAVRTKKTCDECIRNFLNDYSPQYQKL